MIFFTVYQNRRNLLLILMFAPVMDYDSRLATLVYSFAPRKFLFQTAEKRVKIIVLLKLKKLILADVSGNRFDRSN